jgi:3D (Asp-Asp-Asp) domain-containing protein
MAYSWQATTGRNTVVRKQGQLNFSDLLPRPITRVLGTVRRALALLSVVVAIGIATGGTARTIDSRQQAAISAAQRRFAAQSALQAHRASPQKPAAKVEVVELMHDISVEQPAPLTAVQIPQAHKTHTILMEVTAYCSCRKCCGPNAMGLTASGKDVSYNDGKFVAADTSVLPFGTKLQIPGYDAQPVEVIDRGSAIKGHKLDVFFPTHEEALKWGRQMIQVTVVE